MRSVSLLTSYRPSSEEQTSRLSGHGQWVEVSKARPSHRLSPDKGLWTYKKRKPIISLSKLSYTKLHELSNIYF